jgi:hypothetical protein
VTGSAEGAPPRRDREDPILRAKYLDYCSARVAEALLLLSPDEIFLLAQDEARSRADSDLAGLSYERMVQLATERVSARITLPTYPEWIVAYREDPARFDREMMGLWESEG